MEISYTLAELCTLLPLMMRKITPPEGLFPVAAPSLTLFPPFKPPPKHPPISAVCITDSAAVRRLLSTQAARGHHGRIAALNKAAATGAVAKANITQL